MRKLIILSIVFFILSCEKDSDTSTNYYEKYSGIWRPYEVVDNDGTVTNGPFNFNSFFGVYSESIRLNNDKTYNTVQFSDDTNYSIRTDEFGTYEYTENNKKIIFIGAPWNMEFEISKISNSELWLKYGTGGMLIKLRKKI